MSNLLITQVCSTILTELGYPNETLFSLINKWKNFVEECRDGYRWDYSEYQHEIKVREVIQKVITNNEIMNEGDFKQISSDVSKLDNMFMSLLHPIHTIEGNYWWDKGVLEKAGEEYCIYMKNAYGIIVTNIAV